MEFEELDNDKEQNYDEILYGVFDQMLEESRNGLEHAYAYASEESVNQVFQCKTPESALQLICQLSMAHGQCIKGMARRFDLPNEWIERAVARATYVLYHHTYE
jgi:hypothetical protein